jgi:hypothetical protein
MYLEIGTKNWNRLLEQGCRNPKIGAGNLKQVTRTGDWKLGTGAGNWSWELELNTGAGNWSWELELGTGAGN